MITNILHEPNLIAYYQKEYLSLLNYYEQTVRPSIFVKYYNINLESEYEDKLFSTYDYYQLSNIKFDIYEFTPLFFSQTVSNRPIHEDDKAGFSLQAQTGMVVNTIERPRFNDLIEFYQPIRKSYEIFRVINFSTVTSMLHSDPSSEWFELELEYAPIESTNKLNILNHYVYDLSLEKNILLEDYTNKIKKLEEVDNLLKQINQYYSKYLDLYIIDNLIPIATNELIYLLKQNYKDKFKRLLDHYKTPYGFNYIVKKLPYYEQNPFFKLSKFDNDMDLFDYKANKFETYRWDERDKYDNDLEKLFYDSYQLSQLIINL